LACSPDRCRRVGGTLPAEGQALPANLGGIVWRAPHRRDAMAVTPITLHAVSSDGVMTELTFERVPTGGNTFLRVVESLTPDTELVLGFEQEECGSRPQGQRTIAVNVTQTRALPESLGRLNAQEAAGWITVPGRGGLCAQELKASYVDLTLEVSKDAEAFEPSLRYELRVDDEDAPAVFYKDVTKDYVMERIGESSLGRGRDRLYTTCPRDPSLEASGSEATHHPSRALAPGPHRVRMIGIVPDGNELTTEELEIELDCPEDEEALAREGWADGGPAETGSIGGASRRAGREDAGSRDLDAEHGDSGCSMWSAGAHRANASESALLGVLICAGVVVVVRRSRRRSSGRATR
jgi:hypothetical protein